MHQRACPKDAGSVSPVCPWLDRIRYSSSLPIVWRVSRPSLAATAALTSSSVGGLAVNRRLPTVAMSVCSRAQPPTSPWSSTRRWGSSATRMRASCLALVLSGGTLHAGCRRPPTERQAIPSRRPTLHPRRVVGRRPHAARHHPLGADFGAWRHTKPRRPLPPPGRGSEQPK